MKTSEEPFKTFGKRLRMESRPVLEIAEKVKTPRLYAVMMHNDDITTMDFVVDVLVKIFHKSKQEAAAVMMQVHEEGKGAAGVYTYDIAVTKKMHADQMAAEKSFPLRLTVEWVTD